MPEGARAWFNRTHFVGSIMAVGSMLTEIAGALFIFVIRLTFSFDDNSPDEPWSAGDVWFVCFYFIWLSILPAFLLIAFNYARRRRRYLYIVTLLLALLTAAQFVFTLRFSFPFSGISLAILFGLTGWLVTLYLVGTAWSKVRLAGRLAS